MVSHIYKTDIRMSIEFEEWYDQDFRINSTFKKFQCSNESFNAFVFCAFGVTRDNDFCILSFKDICSYIILNRGCLSPPEITLTRQNGNRKQEVCFGDGVTLGL